MRYGFPYKGSKNQIAKQIVDLLPKRRHLYDLFCGGCSVAHAALLSSKFDQIHINDADWRCPTLFCDAINGKYQNETRWISRGDFFSLKDKDPYIAFCWSFGNNGRDYLYAKEIETYKKTLHYAIFFDDLSLAKKMLGYGISFLKDIPFNNKYAAIKKYIKEFYDKKVNHTNIESLQSLQSPLSLLRLQNLLSNIGDYSKIQIQKTV